MELDPLVSPKLKSNFWSLRIVWGIRGNRMGRWPGYGGSGVAYGRMAGLWGSAKAYGEMACVGGRGIAWGTAKTYGKCHKAWETAPAYGRPPDCMGNENHMKAKNGTMKYSLRTLHVFVNFGGRRRPGMGAAGPRGEPAPMADLA